MNMMNRRILQGRNALICFCLGTVLAGCAGSRKSVEVAPQSYRLTAVSGERVVIDSRWDVAPDARAEALLKTYKAKVDSIMSPVVGESAHYMEGKAPESDLSNLVADALRLGGDRYSETPVDVAVTNFGGLRSSLPEGPVTFGNIFEVTPFENTLVLLWMKGSDLRRLFQQICCIKACLSGVNLVCDKAGNLLEAKVGGKPLEDDRLYRVATIDYLAEGNDGFTVFQEIQEREQPDGATLRQLFLDYVQEQTRQGRKLEARVEGRLIIKE